MNSDINNNSDLYSRLMDWLLDDPIPAASASADGLASGHVPQGETTAADFQLDRFDLDPLDLEDVNIAPTKRQNPERGGGNDSPTPDPVEPGGASRHYNMGDMLTVENRFESIIKRKLKEEIERRPPLFPWETEISDYESDFPETVPDTWIKRVHLWLPQLSQLALPVSLPESVLAQLLDACAEVMSHRHQLGRQMVKVVESLFPGESPSINFWTERLLLGYVRSVDQLPSPPYEEATVEQQMLLALLAAKEIITTLTVPISLTDATVERRWQTTAGIVTVQAEYQKQQGIPKLRVIVRLPRGGSLTLLTSQASAVSQRTYPGYLSVESFDLEPHQVYPLEIRFHDSEQSPLVFAIYPAV